MSNANYVPNHHNEEALRKLSEIQSEYDEQRKLHPEAVCKRCGKDNPEWTAENELFNEVNGSPDGIMCPTCFVTMANYKDVDVIITKRPVPAPVAEHWEQFAEEIDTAGNELFEKGELENSKELLAWKKGAMWGTNKLPTSPVAELPKDMEFFEGSQIMQDVKKNIIDDIDYLENLPDVPKEAEGKVWIERYIENGELPSNLTLCRVILKSGIMCMALYQDNGGHWKWFCNGRAIDGEIQCWLELKSNTEVTIPDQQVLTMAGVYAHDYEINNPSAEPKTCSFNGFYEGARWMAKKINQSHEI